MQEQNAVTMKSVKSGTATQDREGVESAQGGEHLPAAPGRTGGAAAEGLQSGKMQKILVDLELKKQRLLAKCKAGRDWTRPWA